MPPDKGENFEMNTAQNYTMRYLEPKDLDQYNALLRYTFQVTEEELTATGWKDEEIKQSKFPVIERADVLGCFDGDNLISQFAVYPLKMNIYGTVFQVGFVTSVCTYPEYTGQGIMKKLMKKSLTRMRENNKSFALLYPYSIPYYRRKGWELISDKISYEIKDYQLPKNRQVSGDVRRVKTDSVELKKTYDRYAAHTHGAIIRDELAWNEYWLWDSDDIMAAIYYNEKDEPDGYIIYWIENEIFHIKDMIFNDEEARTGLWNFVSAHFSMIDQVEGDTYTDEPLAFLLEDASIKEVISPYYMGRIVDFPQFIAQYPFKPDITDREWKFTLTDPIMECNQGTFMLEIYRDGHGEVTRITEKCEDTISIQTMTTMLMGYKRPDYLAKIGRLHASGAVIDMLEDAIEQQVPYISDYF